MVIHSLAVVALATLWTAQQPTGRIGGTVADLTENPLPGVLVTLTGEREISRVIATDIWGNFSFVELSEGLYRITASLPGYEDYVIDNIVVAGDEEIRFEIILEVGRISETVLIEETVEEEATDPEKVVAFRVEDLDLLPLPTDHFHEVFPLVPGVVRDPEGRLSFNGARPSQSLLLVNGANVTDPLTGEFAVDLPLKAIEALEVNNIPYSAEYGGMNAAVAEITTRAGTDTWDFDTGNLLPKLNFRGGKVKGFKSATPQFQVSGPISTGKAWFSQGFGYRFIRSRVYDVDDTEDERILEGFDTFSQLDLRFSERHQMTTTFSYFPQETENLGISALAPAVATPDFQSWGWNAAISERSLFSRSLVETIIAVKSYDVAIRPKSRDASILTPEGLRNNYFNELNRESMHLELASTCTHAPPDFLGEHVLKVGGNVVHTSFSGTDAGLPVELRGAAGQPIQRIEFTGDPRIGRSDIQVSGFVQDEWRLNGRLGLDIGLRYDYDHLVHEHQSTTTRIAGGLMKAPRRGPHRTEGG